jgi:hypothetical protein
MGTILTILVVCASLGGAIELLQEFVFTYRSGEWWDIFCDMLGCLMALFGYVCMRPLHPAERNPTQET